MARGVRNRASLLPLLTRLLSHPSPVTRHLSHNNNNNNSKRSVETLAFEEVEEVRGCSNDDKPYNSSCNTVFVLHGLLGSSRTWLSFSRSLSSLLSRSAPSSEWRMVVVDLRNHGRSAELEGHITWKMLLKIWPIWLNYKVGPRPMSSLATRWEAKLHCNLSRAVLEVIMEIPYNCLSRVDAGQLWVLDSVPGKVSPENSDGEVEKVLQTLQSLPASIPSRKWLVDHMSKLGFSKSLSEWIGSNLKKSGENETWAFNLEGAVQMFDSYRDTDYWSLLEHPPKGTEISIVQADKSDRWDPHVVQRLETLSSRPICEAEGKFSLHVLPNSGHWVHVDNPKGLLDIVAPKIATLA